ncbi:MAG: acetyl-CoA carboxylase, carboxyltransferase subunit beta [Chloroflexota bacterium]|nr:acetyl-CoA carboxylase, carboxyltransferase subunit beta [Chloroflexota bacterium]
MKDWFRRHHPPSFQAAGENNREIPDDLWTKCPGCGELLYQRELEVNDWVCARCAHHFRLRAPQRLAQLTDEDSFEEHEAGLRPADPLDFVSATESYQEKLDQARKKSKLSEAMVVGTARLNGCPLVIAVTDFRFMGGSMGSVYGEKLVRAVDLARERRLPVLTVSASGGARMHEGMYSLMQMAKTTAAFAQLGRERLPHISLLTDPCTGGVTASYATNADVIVAEPGALIGFAGPRVIEQTTRQKLPQGFQTAEFCLQHGMVDMVTPRRELRPVIGNLVQLLCGSVPVAS